MEDFTSKLSTWNKFGAKKVTCIAQNQHFNYPQNASLWYFNDFFLEFPVWQKFLVCNYRESDKMFTVDDDTFLFFFFLCLQASCLTSDHISPLFSKHLKQRRKNKYNKTIIQDIESSYLLHIQDLYGCNFYIVLRYLLNVVQFWKIS